MKRVQVELRQVCDEGLRPMGLSMSQYAVLRALADRPGASAAEVARRCFVTRQSLRDVLGGLTKAKLVEVAEEATVGRARPVTLTRAGKAHLQAAEKVVGEAEERMLDGLDDGERQNLAALLQRCASNLE
ncbi:MarR family transcriptional regulator [Amycolatopsis rhabdoformis]|uniref:MarR family transcriptional regulator n=1 Tax=Amycolatopsis rhabdoformis TaxID=1448059 RepID=A0ABZ1I9L4_9PSEU|nr:MarR family transcriptional regulator [Amycolatopsis rhabdoformis]WSE30115.1 MarR family transcriptional regulator [Amycolatopsis rhabdoformis]